MSHPLDSIVFISIPDDHQLSVLLPFFDASIPLPVQLTAPGEKFEAQNLTREMILAGILAVLAYDQENSQLDYYRSIINALHPGLRAEMTEAAVMKIRNGDFDLAEEIFLALRGLDPEDMETILNLALLNDERAIAMRQAGLDEEADAFDALAFNFYRTAMTAEPPLPDAFYNAWSFYLKQKNYKKTRETIETYLKLEEGTGDFVNSRKDRARQIIQGISSRDLDDDLFKSAFDFISMGEEEKGLEQIRLFMENHPKVWNAWFLLGWGLRRLERWADAKTAFIQALELGKAPNSGIETGYTDICNELSICLMEMGELGESKRWLISALEQESENTKIISNLGMVALREGNRTEAEGFFRTVLEIDPKDRLAMEMLGRLDD